MIINNRANWTHLKTPCVTVSVNEVRDDYCSVFRVRNIIELGMGRKTLMLDPVPFEGAEHEGGYIFRNFPKNKLAIPKKVSNLGFVCTSKGFAALPNVYSAMKRMAHVVGGKRLGVICPEALVPGDFVMFEHSCQTFRPRFSKALRAMQMKNVKRQDAL